jgi:hypothetical protein
MGMSLGSLEDFVEEVRAFFLHSYRVNLQDLHHMKGSPKHYSTRDVCSKAIKPTKYINGRSFIRAQFLHQLGDIYMHHILTIPNRLPHASVVGITIHVALEH